MLWGSGGWRSGKLLTVLYNAQDSSPKSVNNAKVKTPCIKKRLGATFRESQESEESSQVYIPHTYHFRIDTDAM